MGSLRPCGCSGGQLGGLEKRPAIFKGFPSSARLVIDTGNLAANDGEQDLIKSRILFEALDLLDYDLVCLTGQDQALAEQLGLSLGQAGAFDVLKDGDAVSGVFLKRFPERGVDVRVALFDPRLAPPEQAAALLDGTDAPSTIDILILRNCDSDSLDRILSSVRGIDCVVCPSDADEPHLLSDKGAKPLVVTVGRYGRHICRLQVAVGAGRGEPTLRFDAIPVAADLPDDPALTLLYRQYQELVGEAGLLQKYPRIPLPDGLAFTGSEDCRRCHEYEYDEWSGKAHAGALSVLKKVGSDRDPECVICHVVGLEYEGGYVSEEKTPHLKDVGCEACHGPGSEHAQTNGVKVTRPPQWTCLDCHTPDKSTGYAGHEDEYMQKIVHWREPAAAGNVKD
ncbi:MAG: hypothetical protein KBE65_12475 [Phycisphaerae bacterium]|nr:hypothetical protein [Phycisphaerae bacterium]